ncbi:MAG TPA: prolipoprotein diacylglyceryl transferase family protein [Polyangiales bacterium]|nr:prolipoprotein diacylglyceryl transferase family protein [Polyangiales bacterium]
MQPVLTSFELGERVIPIGGYGACLTLALVVGACLALRSAARAGLELGGFIAALAAAVGSGFAGAWLLFNAVELLSLGRLPSAPGLVFYGGAVAGGLGFAALARAHDLPLPAALDALLPALPVAHALGRLGCLLGGCCYGAAWNGPWSIVYTHPLAPAAHPSVARHPWPIYEACLLLGLALLFRRPRPQPGLAALQYVLAYAIGRFALEPLRGDAVRGIGWAGLWSTSQCISIALALGVLMLCLRRRRVYIGGP